MAETLKIAVLRPEVGEWTPEEIAYPRGDHEEARRARLKVLQGIVGGYIEVIPVETEGVSVFGNEEAKLIGLTPSAFWHYQGEVVDTICGPVVAAGPSDDEGELTSITDERLAALMMELRAIPAGVGSTIPVPEPRVVVTSWDL